MKIPPFFDYEKEFNDLYRYFEEAIRRGDLNGDDFDRVDSVLSEVYKLKEPASISEIYYDLKNDEERVQFLGDFKHAVDLSKDASEISDQDIANMIELFRYE
jgi:hypothetical protein